MIAFIPLSNTMNIAKRLEKDVICAKIERFPDGELNIEFDPKDLEGIRKAVVIYSGQPNPDAADKEVFHMAYTFEDENLHPNDLTLFSLYMNYGRHDKKFQDGQGRVGMHFLEDLSQHYGKIHIVDYHSTEDYVNRLGIIRETLVPYIISEMKNEYEIDFYLVPDEGAKKRIEIDCGMVFDGLIKDRLSAWNVKSKIPKELAKKIKGKNVALIDDIISTSGTACKGIKNLRKAGVEKVYFGASHGAVEKGVERVAEASDGLFLGDGIDRGKYSNVTCLPLLKNFAKNL